MSLNAKSILLGLVLAVVVYLVLALLLPSWLAALVGVGVFMATLFRDTGTRTTTTA